MGAPIAGAMEKAPSLMVAMAALIGLSLMAVGSNADMGMPESARGFLVVPEQLALTRKDMLDGVYPVQNEDVVPQGFMQHELHINQPIKYPVKKVKHSSHQQ